MVRQSTGLRLRYAHLFRVIWALVALVLVLFPGNSSRTWAAASALAGSYLGGTRGEGGYRLPIATDADGNLWIVGCTDSSDLPVTEGAAQSSYSGRGDLFVAKLSPSADRLLACTYLGGPGEDGEWAGAALALDSDGSVFVASVTSSPGLITSPDAWSNRRLGDADIYVAHLSPDLSEILAATYLGGTRAEAHVSIVLDGATLLVVGSTRSSRFPSTADTALPRGRQAGDVFVCRVDSGLTTVLESLIIRGSGDDIAEAVCLGPNGSLFLAGWTSSTDLPMPDEGAFASYLGGTYDGFVLRVAADLGTPIAGTYLGGTDWDFLYAMDRTDRSLWVGGHTASADLPVSPGALQPVYSGGIAGQGDDGFVARLSLDLDRVAACTYYGGTGWENIVDLQVRGETIAWIGGTTSSNLNLDADPVDATFAGFGTSYVAEGFVCIADSSLRSLRVATYLGGSGIDSPGGLTLGADDCLWIAGATTSEDLPLDGFAPSYAGGAWRREGGLWGGDLFLLRLSSGEASCPR